MRASLSSLLVGESYYEEDSPENSPTDSETKNDFWRAKNCIIDEIRNIYCTEKANLCGVWEHSAESSTPGEWHILPEVGVLSQPPEMQGRKVTGLSVKRSWIATHRKTAGLPKQVLSRPPNP